jgi:1-deoxy-D-xylulose-5-phosphate synthase
MIDFDSLRLPEDLKRPSDEELPLLAEYLRSEIIDSVSANGGHLASSLGAVELCIALHRVFDLPECRSFLTSGIRPMRTRS